MKSDGGRVVDSEGVVSGGAASEQTVPVPLSLTCVVSTPCYLRCCSGAQLFNIM